MKRIASLFILLLLAAPFITLAHPGHGDTDGYTIIHYFVEPAHAITTFSIMAAAIIYIVYKRPVKQQK